MRTILVILVDRANFGRMWPVMKAIQEHPDLQLRVLCAGSMVLERFGSTHQLVTDKGFAIDSKIYMEIEGSAPVSMAKSVGLGVIEFSSEILRLQRMRERLEITADNVKETTDPSTATDTASDSDTPLPMTIGRFLRQPT